VNAAIKPSSLKGNIHAPTSKSSMQRACAAALLAKGKSIIHHPGHSNDDKAAMDIIQRLGAKVDEVNGELSIVSDGFPPDSHRDTTHLPKASGTPLAVSCGESGLSIRMFTPIIALSDQEIIINGEGSLLNRPMDFFDEILPRLGVVVKSNNGKLPIKVKGPLQPKNIEIDGSLSSQFLTGLLMAYAAADAKNVTIKVTNLTSKPYIDLTLDVMRRFGLKLPDVKNHEEFYFTQETHYSSLITHDYTVEGDWSGGAFLLVAGAIAGPITVRGLDMMSTQADKAIMKALSDANAGFAIEAKGIKLHAAEMKAFEFDATDSPDLFPPLVALASYCKGQTKIKGVNRLTHKESDRSASLQQEFGKMGVKIDVDDDVMIIHGGSKVHGAKVHSRHDHRIAMACAVAALKAEGETEIEEAEVVRKSYPDFFRDLKSLGADLNNQFSIFNFQ
jgi:3-phosphoshikimate 1-carboxyvinyltransferase